MDITFNCDECGQSITIDEAGAGILVECPKCGKPLEVPYKSRQFSSSAPTPDKTTRASSSLPKILTVLVMLALIGGGGGLFAYRRYQYENSDAEYWRNLRGAAYERQKRTDAESGDALAQELLGFDFEQAKDYAEAAKWYRKAGEQGNASAQRQLAEFYKDGKGVLQDYAEAEKWQYKAVESYRKLAEQGDASAQCSLGHAYEFGEGVATNYAEAAKWYRKAAEEGRGMPQWDAQFSLAECYKDGKGVEQDSIEAYKWYNLAAAHGKLSPALAAMERDELVQSMTQERITEGQRRSAEFAAKKRE